ncbi:hypothetical protein BX600DRAFT_61810 [Xylariales sp. PMI_506]|nr:hypothetical protein BX600DRAFT_61810 [Xylariales sp. PMI_506]
MTARATRSSGGVPPQEFQTDVSVFAANSEALPSDYYTYYQYNMLEHGSYLDDEEQDTDLSPPADDADDKHSNTGSGSTSKRKRPNRYKNCSAEVLCRRRAQNRNSQRAFRQRKEERIKELEDLLDEERSKHNSLSQAYAALQMEINRLKVEPRPWLPYDDGSAGNYLPPDSIFVEQALYASNPGYGLEASSTGYL